MTHKDHASQTTQPWTERQDTIRSAEIWLCWKCPDITPAERLEAAVRIANIVLSLRVKEKVENRHG